MTLAARVLLSLALLACVACSPAPTELPPLPLSLHVAHDVDEADADALREGAAAWSTAVGVELGHETGDAGGCGVYLVRGESLVGKRRGGETVLVEDCKVRVYFRPGITAEERRAVATHELGHALLGVGDELAHVEDPASIMFWQVRLEEVITAENVAAVRARLPAAMLVAAETSVVAP